MEKKTAFEMPQLEPVAFSQSRGSGCRDNMNPIGTPLKVGGVTSLWLAEEFE
jgi:hypothetical protein